MANRPPKSKAQRQNEAMERERADKIARIEKGIRRAGTKNPRPIPMPGRAALEGGEVDPTVAASTRRTNLAGMSVKAQQDYLKRMGYEVMVDGRKGPNTITALDAFRKGKAPGQYNRWWNQQVKVRDPHHDASPVNKNNQTVVGNEPGKPRPAQLPPVRSGRGKGKGAVVLPAGRATNNPYLKDDAIDPETYANALADAEYGPVLAELLRQEERTRNVGTNRTAEIRDMYGSYVSDTEGRFAEANKERERLAAATGGLSAAITGAVPLGEAGAAELATRGNIESEYARTVERGDSEYDRRLVAAAQGGGVFAAGQSQREMADALTEIGGKRTDVTAARGASLAKARQEAIQWNSQHAMERAQMMAQIQDSKIKNSIAMAQLQAAMQMQPLESEKAMAEINRIYADIGRMNSDAGQIPLQKELTKAQIAKTRRETALVGKSTDARMPRNFAALRPNDLADLRAKVTEQLGTLPQSAKYTQAVPLINNYLRSLGYKPKANKAVGRFAKAIAASWGASMGYGPPENWWG
jgi:hypothetical protein